MPGALEESALLLGTMLEALVHFVGAQAGWIGLFGTDGRLNFPAQQGSIPRAWLDIQLGQSSVWGFGLSEEPTLLNDLAAVPLLGPPGLRNILSCCLTDTGRLLGHLVLADKDHGFTSHDATAIQAVGHLMSRYLSGKDRAPASALPQDLARLALDRLGQGILITDQDGRLIFANQTWLRWTGFKSEEIYGRLPPYPFWISHRDLATLGSNRPVSQSPGAATVSGQVPPRYLPFRHRNHSLFWCQVETVQEGCAGRSIRIAFMRRLPAAGLGVLPFGTTDAFQALAENLPCAAVLIDPQGRLLWANELFFREVDANPAILGEKVQAHFTPASVAALEKVLRAVDSAELGRRGRLILERRQDQKASQSQGAIGSSNPQATMSDYSAAALSGAEASFLITYWQAVPLPEGPGLFLGFAEDWEATLLPATTNWPAAADLGEQAEGLPLLLREGAEVGFWDDRWERLTGLRHMDLAGVPSEVVLDWLFPHQRDREAVADLLHHPARLPGQFLLRIAGSNGGRSLHCAFFPVGSGSGQEAALVPLPVAGDPQGQSPRADAWLLIAFDRVQLSRESAAAQPLVREFARGLGVLLDHYFSIPVGLAETALDRADLPTELASAFSLILETGVRAGRLVAALQDLALDDPGPAQPTALASLAAGFLEEFKKETAESCEWEIDLQGKEALVRVNPRMIRTVLRQLLANAVDAVRHQDQRCVRLRVHAREAEVYCEVEDTGPGLPLDDWTALLRPFHSTKGPFARRADEAGMDALGLGLTVARHLLALHGGRLEMRSNTGGGAVAAFCLPRHRPSTSEEAGLLLRATAAHPLPAVAVSHPSPAPSEAHGLADNTNG
jgi:PAS domain-containing protein